jgi:hypothetical protein
MNASGKNHQTMMFYYRRIKLVSSCNSLPRENARDLESIELDSRDSERYPETMRTNVIYARICPAYRRPSQLTEHVHSERCPYCPMCMHDTYRTPYCGGENCATIQHEQDIERDWNTVAECSDTSDCDFTNEELEEY